MLQAFTKQFFGYRPKEVEEYFARAEREFQEELERKSKELEELESEIGSIASEIDAVKAENSKYCQKELQLVDLLERKLRSIEDIKLGADRQAKEFKSEALNRLEQKKDELARWQKLVRHSYSDLVVLKKKHHGRSEKPVQKIVNLDVRN